MQSWPENVNVWKHLRILSSPHKHKIFLAKLQGYNPMPLPIILFVAAWYISTWNDEIMMIIIKIAIASTSADFLSNGHKCVIRLTSVQFMMASSNGNIFRVTGPLCVEFTGPGEFPTQRRVTRSFDVFFDLRLNKPLSKQSWGWWFETLSLSLWRHCNALYVRRRDLTIHHLNTI